MGPQETISADAGQTRRSSRIKIPRRLFDAANSAADQDRTAESSGGQSSSLQADRVEDDPRTSPRKSLPASQPGPSLVTRSASKKIANSATTTYTGEDQDANTDESDSEGSMIVVIERPARAVEVSEKRKPKKSKATRKSKTAKRSKTTTKSKATQKSKASKASKIPQTSKVTKKGPVTKNSKVTKSKADTTRSKVNRHSSDAESESSSESDTMSAATHLSQPIDEQEEPQAQNVQPTKQYTVLEEEMEKLRVIPHYAANFNNTSLPIRSRHSPPPEQQAAELAEFLNPTPAPSPSAQLAAAAFAEEMRAQGRTKYTPRLNRLGYHMDVWLSDIAKQAGRGELRGVNTAEEKLELQETIAWMIRTRAANNDGMVMTREVIGVDAEGKQILGPVRVEEVVDGQGRRSVQNVQETHWDYLLDHVESKALRWRRERKLKVKAAWEPVEACQWLRGVWVEEYGMFFQDEQVYLGYRRETDEEFRARTGRNKGDAGFSEGEEVEEGGDDDDDDDDDDEDADEGEDDETVVGQEGEQVKNV